MFVIINTVIIFLFFNALKSGLKVVKKNPNNTAIKNLGNLYKFSNRLYIINFIFCLFLSFNNIMFVIFFILLYIIYYYFFLIMLNNDSRFSFFDDIFPFLSDYVGKLFVIKYGGSAMQDQLLQAQVIRDICFLHFLGIKIVLVHGGGPSINSWLTKLKIQPKFENGIRVTDAPTMEIVEMVLSGKINKQLVSLFNQNNVSSVGLSGKDANLAFSSSLFSNSDNLVGCIDSINNNLLKLLLNNHYLPVISSISSGLNNKTYNINADTFASSIAESLSADKLVLLTDMPGIMKDINVSSSLIKHLNIDDVKELKNKSIISGGMIPKVDCCLKALEGGVKSVHIIDGRTRHALLHELFTPEGIGSKIIS